MIPYNDSEWNDTLGLIEQSENGKRFKKFIEQDI